MRGARSRSSSRRWPAATSRSSRFRAGPRALRRHDPAVGLPRPQGRARRLRAARRLGRALRGDPAPRPPARRPAHGRPRRRQEGRATGAPLDVDARARGGARRDRDLPAHADRSSCCLCGGSLGLLVAFAVRGGATPQLRYTVGTAIGDRARASASRSSSCSRRAARSTSRSTTPTAPTSRARSRRSRPRSAAARRARPGARRAARRPRAPRHRARQPPARSRAARASRSPPTCTTTSSRSRSSSARPADGPRVLPRRPDRPRLAARDRARPRASCAPASRSCSSPATTTPTSSRASSPATARSCSPAPAGSSATARRPATRSSTIAGLRVAGYDDPFERRAGEDFADRFDRTPDRGGRSSASRPGCAAIRDESTSCMVHEPALIARRARRARRGAPPPQPLLFLVGHTHHSDARPASAGVDGHQRRHDRRRRDGQPADEHERGRHRAPDLRDDAGFSRSPPTSSRSTPASGDATARRERLDEPLSDGSR